MKRFLITSNIANWSGELWYSETGRLIRIDVSKSNIHPEVLQEFKATAPVHIINLHTAFEGINVTITEGEITVTFEQWWKKYDQKINKARCIPVWNKLSNSEQVKAFTGIDKYNAFLKKESWRKKLDPENFLKNKTWENEYK